MDTIRLEYTDDDTYIRIINPESDHHNIGYISKSGQISIKSQLYEMISSEIYSKFEWEKGAGMHGGSGYHSHTTNCDDLADAIQFLREVFNSNNIRGVFNL
ncbi:hypothetical protein AB2B38_008435 [Balneola sp. MJW-20]|uniref:hypothetical protein n=1 Tax=Gracilimonas aurantiaca TaxID=3234185 RepID=UPI0034669C43